MIQKGINDSTIKYVAFSIFKQSLTIACNRKKAYALLM